MSSMGESDICFVRAFWHSQYLIWAGMYCLPRPDCRGVYVQYAGKKVIGLITLG